MKVDGQQHLQVIHVGLWVFCTFVLYTLYDFYDQTDPASFHGVENYDLVRRLFAGVDGLIYGAAVTCCLILGYRYVCRQFDLRQANPGHWIVIRMAVDQGIRIFGALLVGLGSFTSESPPPFILKLLLGVFLMLPTVLIIGAAIVLFWREVHWRWFFISDLVYFLLMIVWPGHDYSQGSTDRLLTHVPDAATAVCVVVLLSAVVRDWTRENRQDWIHHAGVVAYLSNSIWSVFWNTVAWRFFLPVVVSVPETPLG